jgi:glucan 1,3-beta-glucosidase
MSPDLFSGTEAEDESQLCTDLSEEAFRERLKVHRDSYITERDFAYLANHWIDAVRIPVPFFIFGDRVEDQPPFVGCIEYLDRAFDWAETYQILILIDLHTVPDSQNGFDNGGVCGVCKWHQNEAYVNFALDLLDRLTRRYRDRTALWGIQVLNEPVSPEMWERVDIPRLYPPRDLERARGSEGVPTPFLMDFYRGAYRRIRTQSPDVTVVFHDGFRLDELKEFFATAGFERFVVDTHPYLMMFTMVTGDEDLDGYLTHVREDFAPLVREMSQRFPLMVGEWSLDTASAKVAAFTPEERRHYYRSIADSELTAWDSAMGWFFWSYKILVQGSARDGWDLGKALELGYVGEGLAPA